MAGARRYIGRADDVEPDAVTAEKVRVAGFDDHDELVQDVEFELQLYAVHEALLSHMVCQSKWPIKVAEFNMRLACCP